MLRSNLCNMPVSRRDALRLCCAVSLSQISQISQAAAARTADLAQQLRDAARTRAALRLPPGEMLLAGLDLPDGATLIGAPGGRTVLKLTGLGPLISAKTARKITLESLTLDGGGAGAVTPREKGLVDITDVVQFEMRGCTIRRSQARGVNMLRSGGALSQNIIERADESGYHSLDGLGVDFDGNQVRHCGDNGVVVFTTQTGRYEGSRIRNNIIEDIAMRSGGNGPYGNGVVIYGANTVRVENNRVHRCAYTHIRNNAGVNVSVIGNDCRTCAERSMYAEFGAKNSTFRNNRIEDVGAGIGVANPENGTDVALVEGNTIIGMRAGRPTADFGPVVLWLTAIDGEKNVEIVGNTIAGPGWIGVAMGGWRDNVRVEANDISGVDYGVVFAALEGAGVGLIARNKIRNYNKAALAASYGSDIAPGDAAKPGAPTYPKLTIRDNVFD